MSEGPTIRRGKSRQDYATPRDFISAVEKRFGPLSVDLAARPDNAKAAVWITPGTNSLAQPWHRLKGLLWLNPPFDKISPWAEKCADESKRGARILFLVPASIGSNWFAQHVHQHALVLALNGRITFEGCTTPYPKDCILAAYGETPGFEVWRWK